jgi:hypothetical protein
LDASGGAAASAARERRARGPLASIHLLEENMVDPVTIVTGIETAGKIAEAVGSMSALIPDTPKELTEKARWMTLTVFNQSQYQLVYDGGSYFNSGRMWKAPTTVPPFSQMTCSMSNADNSFFTGVSGGLLFTIDIPGAPQRFAVGFSSPYAGAYKASVVPGGTAEAAYEAIHSGSTTASISGIKGTDKEGNPVTLSFQLVSESGAEASVTVTQRVAGN